MNDANEPKKVGIGAALLELRRRLAAAATGEKSLLVEQWVREQVVEGSSDEDVHGALIRDQGEWMDMVKVRLENADITVQPIDFEFFDSVRFMTGIGVGGVINRVLAKVRTAKADNEGAELLIIAHSFGTYIASCILRDHPDIRCSRAIFCGSVVPRTFRFDKVAHCPRIVNECGGRDIWPVIAQGFSCWYRYGAAGVWGLRASRIDDRFHDFGHSDYLVAEFVDQFWKPYVERGELVRSPYQDKRRSAPLCISLLALGWWLMLPLAALTGFLSWKAWSLCCGGMAGIGLAVGGTLAVVWLVILVWIIKGLVGYCSPKQSPMPPASPL
jgi:hypothetical protein